MHVLDHSVPLHSGYSFRTLSLLRGQRRLGWETVHLTSPKHVKTGPPLEEVDGFAFHRTPALPRAAEGLPVLRDLVLIRALARRIEEVAASERPDILHAHSPVLNALAALRAARRLKLPVVYEVRAFWEDAAVNLGTAREGGPRYRATRALETFALRRSDAIAAICAGLRDDMVARGIPADRITLIPNGVDMEEFRFGRSPNPGLRASLGLDDRIVLGFLGSYYAYEGLDLLLEALPLILRDEPQVAVLLVGGGPAEPALKAQAERLGLADATRFVGRVPHDRVQSYYDLVDIFVYPRRRIRLTETVTPLKPLEAMAGGGIVLASDVGGHRELIRNRETGVLFRADDREDLARAVLRLIADREQWSAMARRARDFVESERTWSASARGYDRLYAQALRQAVV